MLYIAILGAGSILLLLIFAAAIQGALVITKQATARCPSVIVGILFFAIVVGGTFLATRSIVPAIVEQQPDHLGMSDGGIGLCLNLLQLVAAWSLTPAVVALLIASGLFGISQLVPEPGTTSSAD